MEALPLSLHEALDGLPLSASKTIIKFHAGVEAGSSRRAVSDTPF